MREISIYGDIVPFKWWDSAGEYDLQDLNKSLEDLSDLEEGEELIVNVHTFGGCTATAFAIYNKLQRFKNDKKIKLTTRIDGICASAGVTIFLAGDKRVGNAYAQPFVHNAWTWTSGNQHEVAKILEDLKQVDDQIASLYEARTLISKDQALELMGADTSLTAEDALAFGFFTEMENVYLADADVQNSIKSKRPIDNKIITNNINKMSKKSSKAQNILNSVKKHLGISAPVNLIRFTADQKELDFYELEEGDTPAIGDKAKYDDKPAGESNDGTYVMASGETFIFEGEELTDIIPADTDEDGEGTENSIEELSAENETLKAEVANLKKANGTLKNSLKALNAKLATANELLNKVASIQLEEDDTDEGAPAPRVAKPVNKKTNDLGNLISEIK